MIYHVVDKQQLIVLIHIICMIEEILQLLVPVGR